MQRPPPAILELEHIPKALIFRQGVQIWNVPKVIEREHLRLWVHDDGPPLIFDNEIHRSLQLERDHILLVKSLHI